MRIRSAAYHWTIPISLLLIAWVTVARAYIAPDLLWVIASLIYLAPLLLVLLGTTTVLAILQHRPAQGHLTNPQFGSLIAIWTAIAGFGLFAPTGGLSPDSASPLTDLVGRGALAASQVLSTICLYGFVVAYLTLLVLLIRGLRGRRERRATATPSTEPG